MSALWIGTITLGAALLLPAAGHAQEGGAPAAQERANEPAGRQGGANNAGQQAGANNPGQQQGGKPGERKNDAPLPSFRIQCVSIIDDPGSGWPNLFRRDAPAELPTETQAKTQGAKGQARPGPPDKSDCTSSTVTTLVGTGDVEIGLAPQDYKDLETVQTLKGTRAALFVNGVNLDADARLVGVERFANIVLLRYNIAPGVNSRTMWAALYRQAGPTTKAYPMTVGLGFLAGPITYGPGTNAMIAITHEHSIWWASALLVLLIASAILLGRYTRIFRDSEGAGAFRRARLAYRALRAGRPRDNVLKHLHPGYVPEQETECISLAQATLAGEDLRDVDENQLAVGLALTGDQWHKASPSFSLGRVQLGMWFLFAVATGGFLWVVYGELPTLDGSLLALLGLSIGVTGISLAVDKDNPAVGFRPSRGFFHDMITDWDDQHQVYRFQAVVVNLLLLMVGIFHVASHLTYPIFEGTWLAFLGISGAALTSGKSIVEKKK